MQFGLVLVTLFYLCANYVSKARGIEITVEPSVSPINGSRVRLSCHVQSGRYKIQLRMNSKEVGEQCIVFPTFPVKVDCNESAKSISWEFDRFLYEYGGDWECVHGSEVAKISIMVHGQFLLTFENRFLLLSHISVLFKCHKKWNHRF